MSSGRRRLEAWPPKNCNRMETPYAGSGQREPRAGANEVSSTTGALRHGSYPRGRRWVHCLIAAIVGVITFLTYLPCLDADFVDWDDDKNFLENTNYRGLGPTNLWWMLTTTHMGPYQPLSWMTLGLDHTLWGMNPRGYHATNVVLHSAAAAALYLAAVCLFAAWAGGNGGGLGASAGIAVASLLVALGWALHPQRVESVAWITERRDVLSGLMFLLCIGSYVRSRAVGGDDASRRGWGRWSLVFCVLALLSKATTICLPIVLLLLDVYPLGRLKGTSGVGALGALRRLVFEKLDYILFSAAAAVVGFIGQYSTGALRSFEQIGPIQRLAIVCHGLMFYLGKTFYPVGLSPLYPRPAEIHLSSPEFLWPALAVVALTAALVVVRKRIPSGWVAWACYVAALLPVSGLLTMGDELAADRYSYLPSLSIIALVGGGFLLVWLVVPVGALWRAVRVLLSVAAVLVVIGLGREARRLVPVWHDSLSLWSYATRQSPTSAKAWSNLGATLSKVDRNREAEEACRKAISLRPAYASAHYNLGIALTHQSRHDEAKEELLRAIQIDPTDARSHAMLGNVLMMWLNRSAEAVEHLEAAVRLDPKGMSRSYFMLAECYRQLGRYDAALRAHELSIQGNPKPGNTILNRAAMVDVLLHMNRLDRAEQIVDALVRTAPASPEVLYAVAQLRTRQGRLRDALASLEPALKGQPLHYDRAQRDTHLDRLRDMPDFRRMMHRRPTTARP